MIDSVTIRAGNTAPGLAFTDAVLMHDTLAWSNRQITAVETATGTANGTFTTPFPHGLVTTDVVFFTVEGGTLPVSSTPGVSLENNRLFRISTPSGSTFKITTLDNTAVAISGAGSGTIRVRNATGRVVGTAREDAEVIIPPGMIRQFRQRRTHGLVA